MKYNAGIIVWTSITKVAKDRSIISGYWWKRRIRCDVSESGLWNPPPEFKSQEMLCPWKESWDTDCPELVTFPSKFVYRVRRRESVSQLYRTWTSFLGLSDMSRQALLNHPKVFLILKSLKVKSFYVYCSSERLKDNWKYGGWQKSEGQQLRDMDFGQIWTLFAFNHFIYFMHDADAWNLKLQSRLLPGNCFK